MVNVGIIPNKTFKINKYITLKLVENQTIIYIDGKEFRACKYLLLDVPMNQDNYIHSIRSIDEAAETLDHSFEMASFPSRPISSETEFWGHCSNLQAWAENNYDTRLLHRNLAFPLLKTLTDLGDPIAKRVFKEEIAIRLSTGIESVMTYLMSNGYLSYLNDEELEVVIRSNQSTELFVNLGRHYINDGELSKAIKILKTILKKYPHHLESSIQLVKIYIKWREFKEALQILHNILSRTPQETKALNLLIEIYYKQARFTKCIRIIEQILKRDSQNAKYLNKLAEIYFRMEKNDKAALIFKDLYLNNRYEEISVLFLTLYHLKRQDFKRVQYYYQLNPHNFDQAYWSLQKISKNKYNILIGDLYYLIGTYYEEKCHQVEKCIYYYKKAIKTNPNYLEALSSLKFRYPYLTKQNIINLDVYNTWPTDIEDALPEEDHNEYIFDSYVKNSKTWRRMMQRTNEKRKISKYP